MEQNIRKKIGSAKVAAHGSRWSLAKVAAQASPPAERCTHRQQAGQQPIRTPHPPDLNNLSARGIAQLGSRQPHAHDCHLPDCHLPQAGVISQVDNTKLMDEAEAERLLRLGRLYAAQ